MNSNASPYQPPLSAITPTPPTRFGELKIFSAQGRLGRVRYIGYSMGLALLLYLAIAILGGAAAVLGQVESGGEALGWLGGGLLIILSLAALIVSILLTIQRLHDFDASGWWAVLVIVPLANILLYLVLLIMPGTQGPNRFGYPPPPNTIGVIVLALIVPLIAIIGIIAAIAIPAYVDYTERAGEATRNSAPAPQ